VAICGLVPLVFITYTTSPFVLFMHLHLPPFARRSRDILERFVKTMPPQSQVHLTTMNWLTRPKYTACTMEEFQAAKRRIGIVNYVKIARKGPVIEFNIQGSNRGTKDAWIWEAIKAKQARASPNKA
jgi:hypothetical protein